MITAQKTVTHINTISLLYKFQYTILWQYKTIKGTMTHSTIYCTQHKDYAIYTMLNTQSGLVHLLCHSAWRQLSLLLTGEQLIWTSKVCRMLLLVDQSWSHRYREICLGMVICSTVCTGCSKSTGYSHGASGTGQQDLHRMLIDTADWHSLCTAHLSLLRNFKLLHPTVL
jgi:hypothetical protein